MRHRSTDTCQFKQNPADEHKTGWPDLVAWFFLGALAALVLVILFSAGWFVVM